MSAFQKDFGRIRAGFDSETEDIRPSELRDIINESLEDANLSPALLCSLSYRMSEETPETDKVVGIQFIHTGLRVTRELLDDPHSWDDVGMEPVEEDMRLLGADVLVSDGLGLVHEHHKKAIKIVNNFGKAKAEDIDETNRFRHEPKKECAEHIEAYKVAVEIGYEGSDEINEDLMKFAEHLAIVDALSESPVFEDTEIQKKINRNRKKAKEIVDKIALPHSEYLEKVLKHEWMTIEIESETDQTQAEITD